jgi:hypothetical protein
MFSTLAEDKWTMFASQIETPPPQMIEGRADGNCGNVRRLLHLTNAGIVRSVQWRISRPLNIQHGGVSGDCARWGRSAGSM